MTIDWAAGKGTLIAGGKSLEWASWGAPGSRTVIVLLHEGLGCTALWRDFPAALHRVTGCAVFAYSRAGYGGSDLADLPLPIDYMTRHAQDVLPEVLDAVGVAQVVLMGHSDGATIAAEYAGGVSDFRVRGIVLMAPHFFTEPLGLAEIRRAADVFEATDLRAKMAKYHQNPEATFRGWNDAWLNPDFAAWNVADCIDYLRVPALVIQGRQDQYGTEAQVREVETRSYAPVDVLLLDDCRHSPQFDQPAKVLDGVVGFVQHLERIEAARPEGA